MSIEERLARDIAEVTRGVVVTDSDLRDARTAIDDRLSSRRQADPRRTAVAAAAAAVLLLVAGIAAYVTIGGDNKTAPPTAPGPSASPSVDFDAEFLTGSAPTTDLVEGVWRLDNGGVLMRFTARGRVSWDLGGRLFESPRIQGTYAIAGDTITVNVDGGPAGCSGQQVAMRASVPDQGALHLVFTEPPGGACGTYPDERWVMEQVLPVSHSIASFQVTERKADWTPLTDRNLLPGTWSAVGGGHLLELARNGIYHVAVGSGEQIDSGEWSLDGSRLTLTSTADSTGCQAGDRLVLGAVQGSDSGTRAIRSTVRENTCGAAWAETDWFLIPHDGS